MKKIFLLFTLLLIMLPVQAKDTCDYNKCSDLMMSMKDSRAVLFNVLNLSKEQQGYKDKIDKKYEVLFADAYENYNREKFVLDNMVKHNAGKSALKSQQKVVRDMEKQIIAINNKCDKEYKSILNGYQYSKLKTIKHSEKSALKYCRRLKAFNKQDENYRPFGMK